MKKSPAIVDRRAFIVGAASLLAAPELHAATGFAAPSKGTGVRFAIIADLHHSLMPGAQSRLEAFLQAVAGRRVDFLMQLGDLCHGYTSILKSDQRHLLDTWNSVSLPKHNILGNHEMDACSKACIMDYLNMKESFYSFDEGGVHFVVLDCMHVLHDGKYVDYENGNYFRYTEQQINWADPAQLEWLDEDLRKTKLPTIVFTHPCIHPYWKANSAITQTGVRDVFEKANEQAGWQKVVACISGHEHVNEHALDHGIHYVLINSASYYWVGDQYGRLAQYRDPLFCFVTIDPAGMLTIEGRDSVFLPPTPAKMGYPDAQYLSASISSRRLSFVRG